MNARSQVIFYEASLLNFPAISLLFSDELWHCLWPLLIKKLCFHKYHDVARDTNVCDNKTLPVIYRVLKIMPLKCGLQMWDDPLVFSNFRKFINESRCMDITLIFLSSLCSCCRFRNKWARVKSSLSSFISLICSRRLGLFFPNFGIFLCFPMDLWNIEFVHPSSDSAVLIVKSTSNWWHANSYISWYFFVIPSRLWSYGIQYCSGSRCNRAGTITLFHRHWCFDLIDLLLQSSRYRLQWYIYRKKKYIFGIDVFCWLKFPLSQPSMIQCSDVVAWHQIMD